MRICVISSTVFPVGGHQGLPGYGDLHLAGRKNIRINRI